MIPWEGYLVCSRQMAEKDACSVLRSKAVGGPPILEHAGLTLTRHSSLVTRTLPNWSEGLHQNVMSRAAGTRESELG